MFYMDKKCFHLLSKEIRITNHTHALLHFLINNSLISDFKSEFLELSGSKISEEVTVQSEMTWGNCKP